MTHYICPNQTDSIQLYPQPAMNCPVFWTAHILPEYNVLQNLCINPPPTFNTLISTADTVNLLPDSTTTYTVHSRGCFEDYTFTIVVLPEEDNEDLLDDSLSFECPYDAVNLMTFFSGDSADFYLDSLSNFLADDSLHVNELDTTEHTLFVIFNNSYGCLDTLERMFFVPQPIQVDSIVFSQYLCAYQDCVGEAEVFATTTNNTTLQYFWNEANIPSDTSYVDTLCHGLNALRIVDSLGCDLDTSIYIGYFGCNWDIDFTVGDTALSCYGDLTSIGISINGGTGPITIICDSDTICEITQLPTLYVLTNVQGGDHHIIVQDTLCCRVDTIIHIVLAPDQISMNITTQNNTCYDQCSGSFDAEVTGGVAPYQFFWTLNGIIQSNTEDIDSICAGVYTLGILDNNSCFALYDSLVIEEICCAEIVINLDSTFFSCPGVAEAGAFITVAGGAEPYSFEWIGPTTSSLEDPINMIPGDYTLVVVDANGCSDSLEVVIPSTPMAEDPNNAGFVIPVGTTDWDNTTWGTTDVYFDEDITVPASAILNITGLNLFFTPGHGINVLPNGLLNAENCKFDVACGLYWDGFRVEGFTQPDSIVQRGVIELATCSLTHALVAAASHRITLPVGTNPEINVVPDSTDVTTQGGYIKANGCTFIDNKRDIDIRKTANQKSHIQESLFGECIFRISSQGLPVIPSATGPNVRIFLSGVTNVSFESCNLDNNNPAYLSINAVANHDSFIGLQANNSIFTWEGQNSRVRHFRTGMRISGKYTGPGVSGIARTEINETNFVNFYSIRARQEADVFISLNTFVNLDGTTWDFPSYPGSSARSIGVWIEGTNVVGCSFDIIENQFAFIPIPGEPYNYGTGIKVDNARGNQANLI